MEETSRGPLPIRHSFFHEKGIFHISWMTGALIFLVLSGLAIWLFQFSVTTQVSVLLHTALGIALFIPFTLWQLSHWWASRKAPRSFRKFSAYAGAWTMIVATASGFVLTWQAFFGFFISHFWDRVHLWSGIAAIPFLAYHLYPKARKAVAEGASENGGKKPANGQAGLPLPDFRPGRRHLWAMASATAGLLIVATGVLAGIYSAYAPDFSHYKLPDDYKMPYGPNPFAPSMAMTARGGPVAPELLAGSKSCGKAGCHLCEEAKNEIEALRGEREFRLTEIDVSLDPVLHRDLARRGKRVGHILIGIHPQAREGDVSAVRDCRLGDLFTARLCSTPNLIFIRQDQPLHGHAPRGLPHAPS